MGGGDVSLVGTGTRGAPPRSTAGAGRREGLRLQRLTGFVQGLAVYPLSSEAGMEEGGRRGPEWTKGRSLRLIRSPRQEGLACPLVGVEACGFKSCWCGRGDRLWSLDGGRAGGAQGLCFRSSQAVRAVRACVSTPSLLPGRQESTPCSVSGSGVSILLASETFGKCCPLSSGVGL